MIELTLMILNLLISKTIQNFTIEIYSNSNEKIKFLKVNFSNFNVKSGKKKIKHDVE